MKAAAGAENFSPVFLQSDVAVHGRYFMAHHVSSVQAGQRFAYGNLGNAFLSGV